MANNLISEEQFLQDLESGKVTEVSKPPINPALIAPSASTLPSISGSLPASMQLPTDLVKTSPGGAPSSRVWPLPAAGQPTANAAVSSFTQPLTDLITTVQATANKALAATKVFYGAYSSTALYSQGQIVIYNGLLYVSLQNNNTGNEPDISPTWWQVTGTGSSFLGDWNSSTSYVIGNQVIDVAGGGGYYIAIAANTNEEPSLNPSSWQLITAGNLNSFEGTWSSATAYTVGQIVEYGGAQYIAIANNTNQTPSASSSYWTLLGANALFMGNWSSTTAYTANMIVSYENNLYQAIQASTNENPSTATSYWILTGPTTLDDLENGDIYIKGTLYAGQSLVVPNPNFQLTDTNGVGAAGWSSYEGAVLTANQTGNPPQTNGTYVQIGTSTLGAGMVCSSNFKVAPSDVVFFSAYMISDGTFQIEGRCIFWDGAGNFLSEIDIGDTTSNSWTLYSNYGTAPANTSYCQIYFQREDSNGGSHDAWVTDVQLSCSSSVVPTGSSSLLGPQGNIPASGFAAPFNVYTGYNSAQTDVVTLVSWSAYTIYLADGGTISVPAASTQFPIPVAPTLSSTSGSISAGTWYAAVGIVYEFDSTYYICSISPQASIVLTGSEELVIHSPTGADFPGAVGWVPLINTVTGVLSLPSAYVSGTGITGYVAFGTNVTTNAEGTYGNLTEISGYSISSGAAGFWFFGEATSTTYYLYPAWQISDSETSITAALSTSKSQTAAIAQSGDGYVALSNGSTSWTTPSSSGSASAAGGGSGGGRGLL